MKRLIPLLTLVAISHLAYSQSNVGIGETNPGARLTVKADGVNRPLLIKNSNDDTAYYIINHRHYINGFNNSMNSSLTLNNKYFLPFDQPQLTILASGEQSGINSNGSSGQIEFRNMNTNQRIYLSSYLGAVSTQHLQFYYYNPDDGISSSLLSLRANGQVGFGTFFPSGRMQINHRSGVSSPTLNLMDSTANTASILQFRNLSSSNNWQIRGLAHNTTPALSMLDFATQAGIQMTLTGGGNLGIGTNDPQSRLHLYNATGSQTTYAQFTNPTTGLGPGDGLLTGISGLGHAFILNQEVAKLYLGTSGSNRITISESGNVGIGIDPPAEKLDVSGNINSSGNVRATGEYLRPSTGTANLVPIAYGNISSSGFIQSGSGNYTVSKVGTGFYAITITGEMYQFQTYTTVVTPAGNIGPITINTGSGSGNLHVHVYNGAGAAADSQFCFVVYKQ